LETPVEFLAVPLRRIRRKNEKNICYAGLDDSVKRRPLFRPTVYTYLVEVLIKNNVRYTQRRGGKAMGIIKFENCFNDKRLGKRGHQFWIF
jgi:hypothetical protein